jgi:hypothetical protein
MITSPLRGNTKPALYAQHSCSALEIKGHFHISGPQLIGGEGGLPLWAAAVLQDPSIEAIAIVRKESGTVIQRLAAE